MKRSTKIFLAIAASIACWMGNGIWAIASQAGSVYVSRDHGANWENPGETVVGAAWAIVSTVADGVYVQTRTDGFVKFSIESAASDAVPKWN